MVKLSETLVLARSRASDIESVRKLNCWGSDITDVSILRKMASVTVVSLSVNKIDSLADFAFCKNLEELYIRKNDIKNLNEICHLKKLPKLRVLWLADNPCANEDRYRFTVLKTLPNLQKLDNVAVTEADINEALEEGVELHMEGGEGDERQPVAAPAATNGAAATEEDKETDETVDRQDNPAEMSWQETNKIRQQLGLKPISVEKAALPKPRVPHSSPKHRNANVLQAALCLVKELDGESLEVLAQAVRDRLDML